MIDSYDRHLPSTHAGNVVAAADSPTPSVLRSRVESAAAQPKGQMMNTDTAMQHDTAKRTHTARQRAEGLRWAARLLTTGPQPTGLIARNTIEAVAERLLADAATIEAGQ